MPGVREKTVRREIERAPARSRTRTYVLRLYVTGTTPRSLRAIENIRAICEEHLKGRYDLEVIDIYQQPVRAGSGQIIAAPTLVRERPSPLRRILGDLSNTDRVLMGLDLMPKGQERVSKLRPPSVIARRKVCR